jgi:3-oxoisoapionate decarboxylase
MKVGLGSYAFAWNLATEDPEVIRPIKNVMDLVLQAKNWGLTRIQLADNVPVHNMTALELENLKTYVQSVSIQIELGARGLNQDHLEKYLDLAIYFDSPILRFVIDQPGYEPSLMEVFDIIRSYISKLEQNRISLAIENHDRFRSDQLKNLVEKLDSSHVGICLDTANSIGANEGLLETVHQLAPYTLQVHAKDFTIRRLWHQMGFEVIGAIGGTGMMKLPYILDQLSPFRRCQSIILEQWVPFQDDRAYLVQLEADWAAKSIAYLQKVVPVKSWNDSF